MHGVIKRNFRGLKHDALLVLYKALVRSHLEYVKSACNPHHIQEIMALEQVQRSFIISLPSLKNKPYQHRCLSYTLNNTQCKKLNQKMKHQLTL